MNLPDPSESTSPHERPPLVELPPDDRRTVWLLRHQSWLRLLARCEVDRRWGGRFDPSDVVQQTLLAAWEGWDRLEAIDEPQREAWLRKILTNQLGHLLRFHVGAARRSVDREVTLERTVAESAARIDALLAASDPSPSEAAVAAEQRAALAEALEGLPEDYRQVILLRNLQELTHQQVAQRMDRSEAAVRMLWLRALAALTAAFRGRGDV